MKTEDAIEWLERRKFIVLEGGRWVEIWSFQHEKLMDAIHLTVRKDLQWSYDDDKKALILKTKDLTVEFHEKGWFTVDLS